MTVAAVARPVLAVLVVSAALTACAPAETPETSPPTAPTTQPVSAGPGPTDFGTDWVGPGPADYAAARARTCEDFDTAADAVSKAGARDPLAGQIALVNGAGLLERAADDPAMGGENADLAGKAQALARAYRLVAAAAGRGASDAEWAPVHDAAETATADMRTACR
ncbi:hypothetical protein H7J77_11745 [Mycolicibacillus parakoreensis]|uniref:Lipoprotein n=1 Tax=Mycolicibacillus parakoreensis TaxID=1069221 RepID=A0ABY3U8C4_9MYCO|nr:hypothetical protein [Mycolicibacillus parakoreensis]MCV7316210.1 hypothetical protein [Mycolicibacillus parakoreensis]ULN54797.1 hypothetical protein MIU77_18890 [Mycolicibacillus parakoreensis]